MPTTGATSGIGKEIALEFAHEGAKIAIADLNKEAADVAAAEIEKAGTEAIGIAVDVTDEAQVDAAVQTTVKAFGNIDILISNAGIQIVHAIEEFSFADWKKMLAIHLDGAFLTTRACVKQMIASKKGGSIIYMGSVHSKKASVLKAPYVTAKHGLIGLAKTVAKEGAKHNIRANVICPGFVRTPLVEKQIPEQARTLGRSSHQGRDAQGNGRRRVHHHHRRRAGGAAVRVIPDQRADRTIARSQPRMVHAVTVQFRAG